MELAGDSDKEKPVAQLELEERDKPRLPESFKEMMDFLSDPNVSEEAKNIASVFAGGLLIYRHMQTDEFKKSSEEWVMVQTPIMKALKFDGCTIEFYDPHADHISGAYLRFLTGPYEVIIDAEDSRSIEEARSRGYLSIEVYKTYSSADDGNQDGDDKVNGCGERDECEKMVHMLADDCVETIQDAERVCRLLEDGKEEEALSLIRSYYDLFPE